MPASEPGPPQAGGPQQIFGKYEIIRRLALGGMGEVFLARQTGVAVDRLVILKSLLPELAEQEGFVDQFLDEARVAATLNHPNIVGIYEVGLWSGTYFIAMEFIHGGDLARLQRTAAKEGRSCPYQVSARMIHDAALGLDHAHHAVDMDQRPLHIVHRDISPQNIMVRGDGVTKVVDFGIAKAANRATRTATGMLKGKLQYMAPEQVSGGSIDGRTDQFALGVVLWEMTTNERLFKAGTELSTIERILKEPIPAPSSLIPGFPAELEAVILRMLQRDPAQRYARCAEVARDLQAYLDACSRGVAAPEVAQFVRSVLGDQLDEVTANLQPTQQNFLISLEGSSSPQRAPADATPTTLTQSVGAARRRRGLGVAAGVGLATLLLGAGAFVALAPGDDEVPAMAPPEAPAAAAPKEEPPKAPEQTAEEEAARQKLRKARVKTRRRVKKRSGRRAYVNEILINEPEGAKVFVDGKRWPERVPTVITELSPGQHKIALELGGLRKETKVAIEEEPRVDPPQEPVVRGRRVRVRGWRGARVLLDGVPKGTSPLTLKDLAPGRYNVTLLRRGQDVVFPIEIDDETTFVLESRPAGAAVMIGGAVVGTTPLDLADKLAPGVPVEVSLSKRGYLSSSFEVSLQEGEAERKRVELRRRPRREPEPRSAKKPESEGPGYFTVRTTPWAKISVDGEPKGSTPLYKLELEAGRHRVRLVNEGAGVDVEKTITVQPGRVLKRSWKLP